MSSARFSISFLMLRMRIVSLIPCSMRALDDEFRVLFIFVEQRMVSDHLHAIDPSLGAKGFEAPGSTVQNQISEVHILSETKLTLDLKSWSSYITWKNVDFPKLNGDCLELVLLAMNDGRRKGLADIFYKILLCILASWFPVWGENPFTANGSSSSQRIVRRYKTSFIAQHDHAIG